MSTFYSNKTVAIAVLGAIVIGVLFGWFTAPYGFVPVR